MRNQHQAPELNYRRTNMVQSEMKTKKSSSVYFHKNAWIWGRRMGPAALWFWSVMSRGLTSGIRAGGRGRKNIRYWCSMFNAKWIIQPQYRSSGIRADGVHPPERCLPGESAYFLPTKQDTGKGRKRGWGGEMMMKWHTSTVESDLHKLGGGLSTFQRWLSKISLVLAVILQNVAIFFTPKVLLKLFIHVIIM